MNGPILHIRTRDGGNAYETITDPVIVYDDDDCTYVAMNGRTFHTETPAAEVYAEIERLRAEDEPQPDIPRSPILIEPEEWDQLMTDARRFREALEDIQTPGHGNPWSCNVAAKALKPPKAETEPATWADEFYPVPASELKTASDRVVTEHGLNKWRGALPENLKRYGKTYDCRGVCDSVYSLEFSGDTCALCAKYGHMFQGPGCDHCPIVLAGELACGLKGSAYFKSSNDPRPMIVALEKTLAWICKQEKPEPKPEPTQLGRLRKMVEARIAMTNANNPTDTPWKIGHLESYRSILLDLNDLNDLAKQPAPEPTVWEERWEELRTRVDFRRKCHIGKISTFHEACRTRYDRVLDEMADLTNHAPPPPGPNVWEKRWRELQKEVERHRRAWANLQPHDRIDGRCVYENIHRDMYRIAEETTDDE